MLKIRKNATWARLAMRMQRYCTHSDRQFMRHFSESAFVVAQLVTVPSVLFSAAQLLLMLFFCPPVLSICFIFSPVQWICFAFMRWYISVDLGEGLIMCHVLVVYIECNSKLENLISFLVVELNDFRFTLHFLFIHFCCPCSNHAIIFWLNVLIHYHGHIFMCVFKCVFIIC